MQMIKVYFLPRMNSAEVFSNAWYGQGNGTSYLVSPHCDSKEADISFCKSDYVWGRRTCSHRDDIGISCLKTALGNTYCIHMIYIHFDDAVCFQFQKHTIEVLT